MAIEQFDLDFEGMKIHCYEGGSGFPLLLLHGSGAGTSTSSNWALVLDDLARHYHILAADLIGFGLSACKSAPPLFDLSLWSRQVQYLFDRLSAGANAGVIAHSLSGFLALRLAASNPNLTKVAVTGCPGAHLKLTRALDVAWSVPDSLQGLRTMYSYVIANPASLTDEFYEERLRLLNSSGYAKYFAAMFAGNKQEYLDQLVLPPDELARIAGQVLFIHGAGDRIVPFAQGTLPLMQFIRDADAVLLGNCGHGPALEQPAKFMRSIRELFG
ncbi:MAG: hydrolase [Gammaproteobacteria bacterium]|nr:hydrolase [Gammaproteobacteria bacterium]